MKFIQVNGQEISYQSLFYSPVGTLDWICEQCGTVIHAPLSDKEIKSKAEYYMAHYREYKKQMKRFEKHARKSL